MKAVLESLKKHMYINIQQKGRQKKKSKKVITANRQIVCDNFYRDLSNTHLWICNCSREKRKRESVIIKQDIKRMS